MSNTRRAQRAAAAMRRGARTLGASGVTAVNAVEMAHAAGAVIAERSALGLRALTTPIEATAELSRLVPEKLLALSAASTAVGAHSAEMGQRLMRMASDEATIAMRTASQLWLSGGPAGYLAVQNRAVLDWFSRAFSHSMSVGAAVARSQAAALLPVHRAATGNARRLSKG
jgi:hypothetical protein